MKNYATCGRCHYDPVEAGMLSDLSRIVRTYWGEYLCPRCCIQVAEHLNTTDTWPPIDVPDTFGDLDAKWLY